MMLRIRQAAEKDAWGIAEVHVKSWQYAYKGIMDRDFLENLQIRDRFPLWKEQLENPLPENPVLVAENFEGKIVGFASFGKARMKELTIDGELYAIYLLEEFKGRKIGTKLFYAGLCEMMNRGTKSLYVWVLKENPNCKFYEKFHPELISENIYEAHGQKHVELAYAWRNLSILKLKLEKIMR